jgi:hypothetical protein
MSRTELCVIAAGCILVLGLVLGSIAAHAEAAPPAGDADRIEKLEQRVEELEQAEAEHGAAPGGTWLPEWTQRVRLSGSASVGYFHLGDLTPHDSNAFEVWDARLFVDAELAEDVKLGTTTAVRNIGATVEWNLVREGELNNDVGELYADFQGIANSSWLNTQVGRFQIPVGEAYLRYSRGYRDNPFISQPVGGPWWWDEGLRFYGHDASNRFGYVASVSNGDSQFNFDDNNDPQGTLKLYTDPWPWLHLSVSGLLSGELGHANSPANGALWLGETWAMPIGAFSDVPNYIHGLPVADGPNQIERTWLVGGDAIVKPVEGLRVWLGGGRYAMVASDAVPGPYDRSLYYWIAEVVAEGKLVSPALEPLYLGLRASGLTTGDGGRGYLLHEAYYDTAGYNMRDLDEYSAVLGCRIGRYVRLRGEYAFRDVNLVRGVDPAISHAVDDEHWFAFDVGVAF